MKRLIIALGLVLAACGSAQTEAAIPIGTPLPTDTPVPTVDICSKEGAQAFDDQAHDRVRAILTTMDRLAVDDAAMQQSAYNELTNIRIEVEALTPPECGQTAHAALIEFATAAELAAKSVVEKSDDRQALFDALTGKAQAMAAAMKQFEVGAGIE